MDQIEKNAMKGVHMGQGEVRRGFWWENRKERDHLEDTGMGGRIILKLICKKSDGWGGRAWTFLIWLSRGTCGRLL
jgi:hypothetical protein